jgi:Protein of unknown function (DUF992)
MKHINLGLLVGAALAASTTMVFARADIGVLTCKLKDVHNDIVYTTEEFACEFKPNVGDVQSYTGQIKSLGLDLSITKDMTMVWAVLAPSGDPTKADSLAGKYLGGTAALSVGAGAAANILVGGGKDSFTLQPLSASGIVGAGAALDVEEFELR